MHQTRAAADCSLDQAAAAFEATLIAKSPRTAANYRSALARLRDFLRAGGHDPGAVRTADLPGTLLEDFYTWLLAERGRARRTTAVTYTGAVRAFVRFLDRRGLLHPDLSYERMKDGLRELIGKVPYATPRVDDAVALVVTHVLAAELPPSDAAHVQARLALLRDRAILATLYATGMRRAEIAGLNRADVQDGRSHEGLISGKGERERAVFFDDLSLVAIRAYLQERRDTHRPLFLRHDDGRGRPGPRGERWRIAPQSVWKVVRAHGVAAGVEVTTHHLRHLKARVLLNNGAQLSEVQDLLGHASPETTKKIYAPYTTQHLRQAFDRYSLPASEVARRVRERPGEEEP